MITAPIAIPLTDALTPSERAEFREAEAVIADHIDSFFQVGRALRRISEGRLYRDQYSTFAEYCTDHWGFTDKHGYRMIAAYTVTETVAPIAVLTAESQARPLLELKTPLEQQVAIGLAYRAAEVETEGKLTGTLIRIAVDKVKEMRATGGPVDMGDGTMLAATASIVVDHHQLVRERIDAANEKRDKKAGLIVPVLKRSPVRIVGSTNGNRITLEFSQQDAGKLRELLTAIDSTFELSIVRIYLPTNEVDTNG